MPGWGSLKCRAASGAPNWNESSRTKPPADSIQRRASSWPGFRDDAADRSIAIGLMTTWRSRIRTAIASSCSTASGGRETELLQPRRKRRAVDPEQRGCSRGAVDAEVCAFQRAPYVHSLELAPLLLRHDLARLHPGDRCRRFRNGGREDRICFWKRQR